MLQTQFKQFYIYLCSHGNYSYLCIPYFQMTDNLMNTDWKEHTMTRGSQTQNAWTGFTRKDVSSQTTSNIMIDATTNTETQQIDNSESDEESDDDNMEESETEETDPTWQYEDSDCCSEDEAEEFDE